MLALGAGTSVGSGMPLWPELVRGLMEESSAPNTLFDELCEAGYDLSMVTGIARDHFEDDRAFSEAVRKQLYAKSGVPPQVDATNCVWFAEKVQRENSTMRAIGAMCAVTADAEDHYVTSRGFRANPLIRGIINFNLDTLLREYVEARYGSPSLLRTIESASKEPRAGKINMYYAHGNRRFDRDAGRPGKESANLVLSEADYFDAFNDPTSVFTYTTLHLLREYSVVFLGLSMTDPNIRRLLHRSWSERVGAAEAEGRRRHSRPHFALLPRPSGESLTEAIRGSLEALGVNVCWYGLHGEIPALLRPVYESGGQAWERVY